MVPIFTYSFIPDFSYSISNSYAYSTDYLSSFSHAVFVHFSITKFFSQSFIIHNFLFINSIHISNICGDESRGHEPQLVELQSSMAKAFSVYFRKTRLLWSSVIFPFGIAYKITPSTMDVEKLL